MKVTALLPDDLIHEVKYLAHGKNITDSLLIALREWISVQKLRSLKERVRKKPLLFKRNYSARKVRELNRQS